MHSSFLTNRLLVGTGSQVSGGAIDWIRTIPNITRNTTHKTKEYHSGELSLAENHFWGLTLQFTDCKLEDVGLTFHLHVVKKHAVQKHGYRVKMYTELVPQEYYDCKIGLRWKLSLLDNTGKEVYHQGSDDFRGEGSFRTQAVEVKAGCGKLSVEIPSSRIWHPEPGEVPLLYADTLNVRLRFEYVLTVSTSQFKPPVVEIPRLDAQENVARIARDYMQLYESKDGADFTLVSDDGTEFAVHRTVLRARSEFFAGMQRFNSIETKSEPCVFPDLDAKTLEVLLLYMYGGLTKVPEDLAQSVFVAADKYQFPLLKSHCEALLVSQVMLGTVAHFLILADKYLAPKLREACLALLKEGYQVFVDAGGMEMLKKSGNEELLNAIKGFPKE